MPLITYPNIIYPVATSVVNAASAGLTYSKEVEFNYSNPTAKNISEDPRQHVVVPVVDYAKISYFPIGGPAYKTGAAVPLGGAQIQPWMHMTSGVGADIGIPNQLTLKRMEPYQARRNENMWFAYTTNMHFHGVSNPSHPDPWDQDTGVTKTSINRYQEEYAPGMPHNPAGTLKFKYKDLNGNEGEISRPLYQFRCAMTELNPQGAANETKYKIMNEGLETYDKDIANVKDRNSHEALASPETPTSPLHPFFRVHPNRAHNALVSAYNRTRLPIADIEHRKTFRYIFITRPECYLMSGMDQLCMQAERDEDISSIYARMPHVIRALSPVYVINSQTAPAYANWNYLLCNRVMSMNASGNQLSVVDSMTKGVRGATITPGKLMNGNLGGALEFTFRDTKYMDVYEMIRGWMWYIHKRKIGKFFPPFNGYQYANNFTAAGTMFQGGASFNRLHPYDRALEYCCSVWDVITDETGMNILYWCKYYGLFPTQVSAGVLGSTQNGASNTNEATVSAQFQYQYKRENVYKNLVEFNFNAGIADSVGNARSDVVDYLKNAISYLNREDGNGGVPATSNVLRNYGGASSMFVGSPYIITEQTGGMDPWNAKGNPNITKSKLCFFPLGSSGVGNGVEQNMNLRITNATDAGRDLFLG